jgi:hypothetical protein
MTTCQLVFMEGTDTWTCCVMHHKPPFPSKKYTKIVLEMNAALDLVLREVKLF